MMLSVKFENADVVRRALSGARTALLQKWARSTRIETETGIKAVKERYRSMPTIGPGGTRRVTGNLANSYTTTVAIDRDGVIANYGVLTATARGKALRYATTWERGATIRLRNGRTMQLGPRPPGGALKLTAQALIPSLQARCQQDAIDAMGGK